MKYRILGRTGLKVSELCPGTMTFGDNFFKNCRRRANKRERNGRRAMDVGINFFNTEDKGSEFNL